MKCLNASLSILVASISIIIYNSTAIQACIEAAFVERAATSVKERQETTHITQLSSLVSTPATEAPMNTVKNMSKIISHAKITLHRSAARGHADHGWLNTYHSFSFADWHNPAFNNFGSLRVLNEDRVAPGTGFPTHPHRDFEIFSYILSGELTHRDSMLKRGAEGAQSDKFYRMRRGDVQFTTGGTGIAHSEQNEHSKETVHFLQIWVLPWRRGYTPRYHTRHFDEDAKRQRFVPILSPIKGGAGGTIEQEQAAEPTIEGTIPIHADFVMGAGIIPPQQTFEWHIGANATQSEGRKVFVHLPMTKGGKAKIRINGHEEEFREGDGAFVDLVRAGDRLLVESIGEAEAEVVVLDTC